jgi:teichuronic acid biosynthesis glycosyltransferase TuaG
VSAAGDRPLVSVCVPAYQAARFIGQALDSILAQTYPRIEVIVVDDGSTDDTPAVVARYRDRGVRYRRLERNRGGYAATNVGLALARGSLITWYNHDDVYDPTIVEREVSFLLAHPEAVAVCAMDRWIDAHGRVDGHTRDHLPREVRGGGLFDRVQLVRALMRHRNTFIRFPSVMARTQVARGVGGFEERRFGIAGDLELCLRLATRGPIGILDEELMSYRHFPDQWTAREKAFRLHPDRLFDVLDHHLADPALAARIDGRTWARYRFLRRADATLRAANALRLGRPGEAERILASPEAGGIGRPGSPRALAREVAARGVVRLGAARLLPRRAAAGAIGWILFRGERSTAPAAEGGLR